MGSVMCLMPVLIHDVCRPDNVKADYKPLISYYNKINSFYNRKKESMISCLIESHILFSDLSLLSKTKYRILMTIVDFLCVQNWWCYCSKERKIRSHKRW